MESTLTLGNPYGNTGLKLQTELKVLIDYFTFTCSVSDRASLTHLVDEVAVMFLELGGFTWHDDKGLHKGRYYEHSASSTNGILVGWSVCASGSIDVWVSVPGRVCSSPPQDSLHYDLCKLHRDFSIKPTRIDIALDDYSKSISFDQVCQAVQATNYTGFRSAKATRQYSGITDSQFGFTWYFGSRQSDKMVRYYNKSVESRGVTDSYRFEVELKDFKAKQFFEMYISIPLNSPDLLAQLLLEIVIGSVSFIDRSADSNVTRCPLLDWWEAFISFCRSSGGVRLAAYRPCSSIAKSAGWVCQQVETTLALLREALGYKKFQQFLDLRLRSGVRRMGSKHEAMLRLHRLGYDQFAEAFHT